MDLPEVWFDAINTRQSDQQHNKRAWKGYHIELARRAVSK
jgi:hypothetical protein